MEKERKKERKEITHLRMEPLYREGRGRMVVVSWEEGGGFTNSVQ